VKFNQSTAWKNIKLLCWVKEVRKIHHSLLGVGKSTFVVQYIQNIFIEEYDPTITEEHKKIISFQDKKISLSILDTDFDGLI
jgi:hypothetical protein